MFFLCRRRGGCGSLCGSPEDFGDNLVCGCLCGSAIILGVRWHRRPETIGKTIGENLVCGCQCGGVNSLGVISHRRPGGIGGSFFDSLVLGGAGIRT